MTKSFPLFVLGLSLMACTKPEPRGNPPSHTGSNTTASAPPLASTSPIEPSAALPTETTWVEAVRFEDWKEAGRLLDALDEKQREKPEIRYVRARVALALEDWDQALRLFDGLESTWQDLAADISMYQAQAQLHGGQQEKAAATFARQSTVKGLTQAALAWSHANQPKQARIAIDKAIRLAKDRIDDDAIEARRVRAGLASSAGNHALASEDLRFVAKHTKDSKTMDDVSAQLLVLNPKQKPSAGEHMDRAVGYASRGHWQGTETEILHAIQAPGGPPSKVDQLMARAQALYNSRQNYDKAAEVYEEASRIKGEHVPRALYFAGKAWSRANDNERGLKLYDQVVREYRSSTWAERACYHAARLQRFQGQWSLAEKTYETYLKRHPKGLFVKESQYEVALCKLLSGKHKEARTSFERLGKVEKELQAALSYRYLAAVAAHQEGKTDDAISVWRGLVQSHPLSFFALASAARLTALGHAPPPPIAPGPSAKPLVLDVKLPPPVGLLTGLGLDIDAEEHLRTMEGTFSRAWGEHAGQALCHAYGQLQTGARLHRMGQRHVPVRLVQTAPSASTRWAWECMYPTPYSAEIERLEHLESLPTGLIHAVIRQESAFQTRVTSPVGAQGLMQLMPQTAAKTSERMSLAYDPNTITAPGTNLRLGAHYLGMLLRMMKENAPLAIGAYNAGPSAVGQWIARSQHVPLDICVALIPYRETRHYIWRVIGNWARYRYLTLGESGIPALDLKIPEGIVIADDAY